VHRFLVAGLALLFVAAVSVAISMGAGTDIVGPI
jgi:hypothetical protein